MRPALAVAFKALAVATAAVLAFSGLADAPAQAAGTRTITGHVYLNNTSTPATTGDAVVEFTRMWTTHDPANVVAIESDGSYTISGLDSDYYTLFVRYTGGEGYSDMYWKDVPTGTPPGYASFVNVSTFSSAVADITLGLPAAISGTVKLGTAQVLPAAGEVAVYYSRYVNGVPGVEEGPTYVDSAGRFTFPAMAVGAYTFRFDYLGTGDYLDRDWIRGGLLGYNTPVRFVGGAGFSGVNIVLPPTSIVSGVVRLADSPEISASTLAGVGAVSVALYAYNAGSGSMSLLKTTTTDSAGRYSFTGLSDQTQYKTIATSVGTAEYYSVASLPISSTGSFSTITMFRKFTVSGHINLGNSEQSAGAGEVTVTFVEANGKNNVYGYGGSAVTDANGNYSISGLAGQYYFVTLTYNGTGDYHDTSPVLPIAWSGSNGLWMPTPAVHDINFSVDAGNSLSGTVRNSSAQTLSGVTVYAVMLDPITGDFVSEISTTTDAQGRYEFSGLVNGFYVVQFEASGYAPQSYTGVSYYYAPDVLELTEGATIDGIDAAMYRAATISGRVSGPNLSSVDYMSYTRAWLQVFDSSKGEWSVVDVAYLDGGGRYSFSGLAPDRYRVVVNYQSFQGTAYMQSPVLIPGENQTANFSPIVKPAFGVQSGTLLRGPSGIVYMADSFATLTAVRSIAAVTDSGRSGTITSVTQDFIDNYIIREQPLSNIWFCDGSTFLAAEGKIWPIDESLVDGLAQTNVDCSNVLKATSSISGALYLKSPSGAVFMIDADGVKHPILTAASFAALVAPNTARAYTVNEAFLTSLPNGLAILPVGSMVKGPGPRVYFVAGFQHLVPMLTFEATSDMGLPSSFSVVSQADLDQAVIDPDSAALSNVLVCGAVTYVASAGKLWPVDAALVAPLPKTTLDASACSVLPKSTTTVQGALFLTATTGGAIYQVLPDGTKRQIISTTSMAPLAAPYTAITLKVGASFLNAIPTAPKMLPVGQMVKGTGPRVYFVAGPLHLVPVLTFEATADMGLPSSFSVVSQVDLDQAVKDPDSQALSNVLVCGSITYIASAGKLWPVDAALVAGVGKTELDASACATLPKSATSIQGSLFVAPTAGGATWQVQANGSKRQVISTTSLAALAAPSSAVVLKVGASFINAMPTATAVLPVGQMVKGPGARVYFVAGFQHLVPMLTFEATSDMGLPSSFSIVSQADLDQAVKDPDSQALSNVLVCATTTYIATAGKLTPVDAALVVGLPKTVLDASACSVLPKSTTAVQGALFLTATAGGAIYQVMPDGTKRQLVSTTTMAALAAPSAPVLVKVGASFLNAIPTAAAKVLPVGSMVKGPGPRVYFVAGFQHLVPMLTFEATSDMGLPSSFSIVSQADLDQAVKDPDSQALSNILVCDTVTYIASAGKLWPVDAALVAGLAKTALDASACSVLPKSASAAQGALFVTPAAGGAIYQVLSDGTKKQLLANTSLAPLSAPYSPLVMRVGASFLNSMPTAATKVLPVGSMVKGPGPRVYFVAGFQHLVPMLTFEATADMGLPSTFTTVSQADLDQAVKDPDSQALSNVLVCGSITYVASGGKLVPVAPSLTAGLAKTTLDASTCSLLPKAATTVQGALLLTSVAGGPTYQVMADGSKRSVAASALAALSAPYSPQVLKVGGSFLAALPPYAG